MPKKKICKKDTNAYKSRNSIYRYNIPGIYHSFPEIWGPSRCTFARYVNQKQKQKKHFRFYILNSHAGGMAVARPYGFEIDFVRNPISGSAAWFFVIILKFIFTPIYQIKISEKNSWRFCTTYILFSIFLHLPF